MQELNDYLEEFNLTEIEYTEKDLKVKVSKVKGISSTPVITNTTKQEIEKRLDKPALKQRIKRIAKRIFKDVRKKEVQRKKG